MTTPPFIARRNWAEDGVFSGGNWLSDFSRVPYLPLGVGVAALNRLPASTMFDCDLGAVRQVGAISANLWISPHARIRLRAGTSVTFATTAYDSGIVSGHPMQSSGMAYLPWGDYSFSGLMDQDEIAALEMRRVFPLYPQISARYIRLEIWDRSIRYPPRVGFFGVWETWFMLKEDSDKWSLQYQLTDSEPVMADFGSKWPLRRATRRRFNAEFGLASDSELALRWQPIANRNNLSTPTLVILEPDTSPVERMAFNGLLTDIELRLDNKGLTRVVLSVLEE